MPIRANRDTIYAIWVEEGGAVLGVWYQDEFVEDKPAIEQLDKALFIDPISPRGILHLSLHFLHVGLRLLEGFFQEAQGARKPPEPALPDNGKTVFGKPFLPGRNGDAPSESE